MDSRARRRAVRDRLQAQGRLPALEVFLSPLSISLDTCRILPYLKSMKNEAAIYQAMQDAERKAELHGELTIVAMEYGNAPGAADYAFMAAHYALLAMELSDELYGTK